MSDQKISNPKGITVAELSEFLHTQPPSLLVAAACGCGGHGGWSTTATEAYVSQGTATSNRPHLKVGWSDSE